jgi:dihydroflavonol-4-reductase
MTTLVTGATGFLGSHLTRLLVERGHRVRVLARPASRLDAIVGVPCEIVQGDLRDKASLVSAMRGVGRVFHAAADYRLSARDPRELYESNVTGTRNLLDVCRAARLERFVYTSSVATIKAHYSKARSISGAMAARGRLPNESDAASIDDMVGHYKRSKLLAEQQVLAAASDIPIVVVNPTAPVGPGDWKPTPTGRIIVDFMRGRMLAYVETGLNLVPVEDVAAGHLLAAERGETGQKYILGGINMQLKEIFDALAAITGRRAPSIRIPHSLAIAAAHVSEIIARASGGDPVAPLEGARMARLTMFVDTSKARRELGFEAGSVPAALERAVRWYAERGYGGSSRLRAFGASAPRDSGPRAVARDFSPAHSTGSGRSKHLRYDHRE